MAVKYKLFAKPVEKRKLPKDPFSLFHCSSCIPMNYSPPLQPLPISYARFFTQAPLSTLQDSIFCVRRLTRSTLVGLAEHEELGLVVDGEHTSTGNTTEDVSTGTLEERLDTLSGDDLPGSIESTIVFDSL